MEETMKKNCTFCGAENPQESKFCSNCGSKLEEPVVEKEIDIHYEEETIYNNNELFNEYYATDYREGSTESETSTKTIESENKTQNYVAETPITYTSANTASSAANSTNTNTNGNIGFAIASMVCGIISLLCCCTFFGVVVGIGAVVLGIIAIKSQYAGKGMAIAGIVTGGIGIFIWLTFMIIGGLDFFVELFEY